MKDVENYWDKRATSLREYEGEEFYTITDIPFYKYRRKRTLEILDAFDFEDKRILDVGCGDGYYSRCLKKRGADIIGVDISGSMIELAEKNTKKEGLIIPYYKISGQRLEFEENSFDYVLTVAVLQHILDEHILSKLLSEISRVVVIGGGVIIFEHTQTVAGKGSMRIGRTHNDYKILFKKYRFTLKEHHIICPSKSGDGLGYYLFYKS